MLRIFKLIALWCIDSWINGNFLVRTALIIYPILITLGAFMAIFKTNAVILSFKAIFEMLKGLKSWKGVLSVIIVWLVISGSGLSLLGVILRSKTLVALGGNIYFIWLMPMTPLMPLTFAIGLMFQRFVFRDYTVDTEEIRRLWGEVLEEFRGGKDDRIKEKNKRVRD